MRRALTLQQGVVILEALIAILIFSIGILALVAMQATAIGNVADAKYRSTASFLADEILGSVWATRINAFLPNASDVMVASPDPSFACAPCNATNGNAYTQQWASSVAAELPRGSGSIAVSGNVVTVSISWQPPDAATVHNHTAVSYID